MRERFDRCRGVECPARSPPARPHGSGFGEANNAAPIMTDSIADKLRILLAEGQPAAIVTVSDAKGSTPRERGAQMLVTADDIGGSIGGGQLELRIIAQAREFLKLGSAAVTAEM